MTKSELINLLEPYEDNIKISVSNEADLETLKDNLECVVSNNLLIESDYFQGLIENSGGIILIFE